MSLVFFCLTFNPSRTCSKNGRSLCSGEEKGAYLFLFKKKRTKIKLERICLVITFDSLSINKTLEMCAQFF